MPLSDFVSLESGYSINPDQISLVDLRNPAVVIQVGANSVLAEGADADTIRALLPKPAEHNKAAEHKTGEHPPLLAPGHKPDPNDPGRKPESGDPGNPARKAEPEPVSHKSK
jgi:hypothetical protein